MFKFKQFEIKQDKTAMKVGTDGVLLGAWINFQKPRKILDVGTGTGLIALMAAQKFPQAKIFAVEIDTDAFYQASENVKVSAWSNRISVYYDDFLNYAKKTHHKFDIIASNPPFFENHLVSPLRKRTVARHNIHLPFQLFIKSVKFLLSEIGEFFIILPTNNYQNFLNQSEQNLLFCKNITFVKHYHNTDAKRVLLKFSKKTEKTEINELIIKNKNSFTDDYVKIVREFYLFM